MKITFDQIKVLPATYIDFAQQLFRQSQKAELRIKKRIIHTQEN